MSSEADVAFFISHQVGFMMVVELLFCIQECFVKTAFTRPTARWMAGPVKVRNDVSSQILTIGAEHVWYMWWWVRKRMGSCCNGSGLWWGT